MTDIQVEISEADLTYINDVLNSGTDLYRAYDRILEYLENEPELEFFFEGATITNRQANDIPLPTSNDLASTYIFSHTGYGLALDGISVDVGNTSNAIARAVLEDIIDKGGIPPLEVFLPNDALNAISIGQQTIGGWGGAFYYWDLILNKETGQTVGDRILADGGELEKFILSSTVAAITVITQELNQPASLDEIIRLVKTTLQSAFSDSALPSEIITQISSGIYNAITFGEIISEENSNVYGDWVYNPENRQFVKIENGQEIYALGSERFFLLQRLELRANVEQQGLNDLATLLNDTSIVDAPHGYNIIHGSEYIFTIFDDHDTIIGTDGNDAIFGYSGDDVVFAGNGDDYVRGASDEDELHGQDGNDQLFGGSGNDALIGGTSEVDLPRFSSASLSRLTHFSFEVCRCYSS